jgi:hypothetical protein
LKKAAAAGRTKPSQVADNGKYWGQLSNDNPNGFGKFVFDDGSISEGQFTDGILTVGCSTNVYAGGTGRSCGRFVDNTLTGTSNQANFENGILVQKIIWPESRAVAVAEFFSNAGRDVSGMRYEGQLKGNQRNGYGVAFFPDGSRYEGQWWESKFSGFGAKVSSAGITEQIGLWDNGAFVGDR